MPFKYFDIKLNAFSPRNFDVRNFKCCFPFAGGPSDDLGRPSLQPLSLVSPSIQQPPDYPFQGKICPHMIGSDLLKKFLFISVRLKN